MSKFQFLPMKTGGGGGGVVWSINEVLATKVIKNNNLE